jgi:hypothetical protein
MEYLHQHLPQKSPSFVGKYTSTMEHMGIHIYKSTLWLFNPFKIQYLGCMILDISHDYTTYIPDIWVCLKHVADKSHVLLNMEQSFWLHQPFGYPISKQTHNIYI